MTLDVWRCAGRAPIIFELPAIGRGGQSSAASEVAAMRAAVAVSSWALVGHQKPGAEPDAIGFPCSNSVGAQVVQLNRHRRATEPAR